MLRVCSLPRSFARLYNAIKNRPRSIEKTKFPSQLRESPGIKGQVEESIKNLKVVLPVSPISETLSKTGKEIKATEKVLSIRTSTDLAFESKLRKTIASSIVTKVAEDHRRYMEENLFILDRSVESRKNVLLAKELETFQAAIISNREEKRRKELKGKDVSVLLEGKSTVDVSVDRLLSHMSSTFAIASDASSSEGELVVAGGEEQLMTASTEANSELVETTGERISYTGVIDLTGRTTARLSFTHLTHRELSNYICYNIHKPEGALQLFVGSRESSQFDPNLKASLVQKLALISSRTSLSLDDPRLKDLLGDLSRCVVSLSNKNVCDSLWAVCKLFSKERQLNTMTEHLIQSLAEQVCLRIKQLNGMNLAYVCDGLWRMKLHLPVVGENLLGRVKELMTLMENMVTGEREKPIDPWNYNVTTQPSVFCGFQDHTLPKYPLPSPALEMITRYVANYPYFDKEEVRTELMVRSAKLLNKALLSELNTETMVSLMRTFGQSDQIALRPQVQSLFRQLSTLLLPSVFSLSLRDSTSVLEATLNAGLYSFSELFKELELSSTTVLHSVSGAELVAALKVWARYYYSFACGIDPGVDPAYVLLPKRPLLGAVVSEFLQLLSSYELTDTEQLEIAKIFASLGHRIDYHPSLPGIKRLASNPIYYPSLFLLQSALNQTGFLAETLEDLPRIMNKESIEMQVQCLLALAHVNAKVELKEVCMAVEAEIEEVRTNRDAVPILWALTALGVPETQTIRKLIDKIDFQRLTRLETMLVYQLYLSYQDFLQGTIPDSIIEAGPSLFHNLNIYENAELPPEQPAERDKRLPGYFVQFYEQSKRQYWEKYRMQCFVGDGKLVGMLRMRENYLEMAGFKRREGGVQ